MISTNHSVKTLADWSLIFNAEKKENFVIVGFNDKYLESFDQFYSF